MGELGLRVGEGGAPFKVEGEAKSGVLLLPDNAIDGFRNGAVLDLRVRLAMEMLMRGGRGGKPAEVARWVLDTAGALFDLAEERGLIEGLDSAAAEERLSAHARRSVVFGLAQQKEAKRQADEAARLPQAASRSFKQ